ncbi:MAG: prepilin-type N-terminal cleavage/methylation domain-containing protein [Myxococcota bacterium]
MARTDLNRTRGFTLVELMIVVAIIGVLASVAIPSYLNYQLTAKRSEGYANLASLAKAQKAYFAEFNDYIAVAAEPSFTLGQVPTTVTRDSTPINAAFSSVGWVPEGDVFFDYDTATPTDPLTGACTCTEACFTATAYGNLDGDASLSVMLYTHPDRLGGFCETGQGGNQTPPFENGSRMFDQVARVLVADDF